MSLRTHLKKSKVNIAISSRGTLNSRRQLTFHLEIVRLGNV